VFTIFINMSTERPQKKTDLKREKRRQKMLDVSLTMIAQSGLDAFSLHKLANKLQLTVGALYRYFPSKGTLIAALENQVIDATRRRLLRAISGLDELANGQNEAVRALGGVLAAAYAYRAQLHDSPEQMRLIGGLMSNPKPIMNAELAKDVIDNMMSALEPVAIALEKCEQMGQLNPGPSQNRAIVTWAALRGVAETKKLSVRRPDLFDEETLFHITLTGLLVGWGADPEALQTATELIRNHLGDGQL